LDGCAGPGPGGLTRGDHRQLSQVLEYLGLNDGEDEYDEIDERERERERERPRQASPEDELERAYRERPNVRKIGPRRRSEDFEDIFAEDSPVGSGRGATAVRPAEAPGGPSRCSSWCRRASTDAQQIADKFKTTVPVISTCRAPRPTWPSASSISRAG